MKTPFITEKTTSARGFRAGVMLVTADCGGF
jgi:hypothetical protein